MLSPKASKLLPIGAVVVLVIVAVAGFFVYRHSQVLGGFTKGGEPRILSLLPNDAPVLAYLDAKALRSTQNSSLAELGDLVLPGASQDRDYVQFVKNTGFDYTRDLDHAALALWPSGLPVSPSSADSKRSFAVADGRFDQRRIESYALRTGHSVNAGGHSIYTVSGSPPVSFLFLSPTRVELASGKDANELLIASLGPQANRRDAATQERINRVAAAPLFAVARTDNLPDSFYANFKTSASLVALLRGIQGVTAGVQPDGDALALTLDAECDSMKNALSVGTLIEGLRLFGSAALADPKSRGQLTKEQAAFLMTLLAQVKVTPQDKWVRLSLDVTPAMLNGKTSR